MNKSTVGLLVLAILVAGVVGIVTLKPSDARLGGTTRGALTVDNTFAVTGAATFTGTATLSGANTLSGATTLSAETRIFRPRSTGAILNLASSSVTTLTAAQTCDSSVITQPEWTGIASSTAIVNLPSAATLTAACLPTNGDSFQFVFRNLATAAGSSTAVIAGASTTLVGVDANADIINGANEALIQLVRYSSTEVIASITELTAAD